MNTISHFANLPLNRSRISALLPLLVCGGVFFTTIAPAAERQWSDAAEKTLGIAGRNRAELVKALERVSPEQKFGLNFLIENMPQRDAETLSSSFLLTNVSLAYSAWQQSPWSKSVSEEMFQNEILPYASVSEPREDWRHTLREIAAPLVADCKTPSEAAQRLNQKLFKQLGVRYSMKRRATDQGPLETMKSGVATCTGLSILLVDACRAVGVPARVVGTPLWINKSGNHTWVEIWDGDWHFLGAAEPHANGLDHAWFERNAAQAIKNDPQHAIYASSFKRTGVMFPLEWSPSTDDVNAVNVTDRYTARALPTDTTKMTLRVNVLDRPVGERVAASVIVTDASDPTVRFEATSKTEPADINDHASLSLSRQRTYIVEARHGERMIRTFYSPGTNADDLLVLHLSGVPVVNAAAPAQCVAPIAASPLPAKDEVKLKAAVAGYFNASTEVQASWVFPKDLDSLLAQNEPAVRRAAWEVFSAAPIHDALKNSFAENKVRSGEHVSPYTVKTVGTRPPNGWALFIAMHGGGGATQELNDSQWLRMQSYYRDHPEAGGYRYVALRAPNNKWNGFYTDYVYPLIGNLVQQFVLFSDVDPNKVFLMGYSHGGYGAFGIGPKIPDHFAAIHSSAAAPADGAVPQTLRNTVFTCMVGEKDTDHGRIVRCRRFDEAVRSLRGERTDIFPVTVTVIAGHPHSGLPDRDKIAEMYPAERNPVPRELTWTMTDDVIADFFWLQSGNPVKGREFNATCRDNRVTVTTVNLAAGTVLLDSRLVDFSRPVTLELNGKTSTHSLTPNLRTLCETMKRRGDPDLAFTARIEIPKQTQTAAAK